MIQVETVPLLVEETEMTPVEAVDFWSSTQGIPRTEWAERRGVSQQTVSQNVDSARDKIKDDTSSLQPIISSWIDATIELINQDIEGEITLNSEPTLDQRYGPRFDIDIDPTPLFEHHSDSDRYSDADIPSRHDDRFDRVYRNVESHLYERWCDVKGNAVPSIHLLGFRAGEWVDSCTIIVDDLY